MNDSKIDAPEMNALDRLVAAWPRKRVLPEDTDENPWAALQFALDYVTEHWKEWNQQCWIVRDAATACGTSACLAGTAVILAGKNLTWQALPDWSSAGLEQVDLVVNGTSEGVHTSALKLLGLPHDTAVFDADNTLGELWAHAHMETGGALTVPDSVRDGSHPAIARLFRAAGVDYILEEWAWPPVGERFTRW